ncbi:MAG: hypothetical protein A3C93_00925 [Candidatus Lloydbacteria bacterium RIFCSPHIGHO2_02_FULL_54_17]|uniref:Uncharacterized protein n=1 Tax=Candidatus Lloydbacteria bacterium RIFCSPHIGHO2_02_FULL_54_17 TaxID=1798664 RepID=A0A1G2DF99_9BACT|nr:MAG: hypothetical protein A2762_01500 [Candidatus Lloydbacteria bacterium RIFCSPHIGHO2_01_FULL_54_11]OGZ11550.1 MAG: hypothetical protein A3C93_00925 [Candidatus Lloydbacteria bacterium RIFCSPHIGHO2_02_FULL_54_17]OGZ14832.1 MAG: hypothetical protein A3H76_05120 [Candidatus Lloydbacteria bacterium RIFCSPLOWO2_02_FULL_54_12]
MDPEQNTAGSGAEPAKQSPTLLIVGAVVILVIVAWFMLMSSGSERTPVESGMEPGMMMDASTVPAGSDAETAALSTQGTSDEVADIEADLNATDLNSLNEVDQI